MTTQPLSSDRVVGLTVAIAGSGDVGSAVAHRLFRAGADVIICDGAQPTVTRRGMAFADAVFDRSALLDGVQACRVDDLAEVPSLLRGHAAIPLLVGECARILGALRPDVLVDARMRKRERPASQRGLAPLTIGLGPGFVAGQTVELAIETSWEALGEVLWRGSTRALDGEPRSIAGHGRDRYVYASATGTFRTSRAIGDHVTAGDAVASVNGRLLGAPLAGCLRGLCRDGVAVSVGTKVIEIDPRGEGAIVTGIGERPRQIADAVLAAVHQWRDCHP